MPKFRKKQVVIEAIQFTGNDSECMAFCPTATDPPDTKPNLIIPTLEGNHLCSLGDWIVRGVEGEFYPVKDSIFRKTYEPVESDQ
jgi:hypothetical protein